MIPEEIARRERLRAIQESGAEAYPRNAKRTHVVRDVLATFDFLEKEAEEFSVAGRIRAVRKHGGLTFIRVEDETGILQVALHRDVIGAESYQAFHERTDVGDFYSFTGTAFHTKKGEPSLDAKQYQILTKSLLPLPEKWHGLSDTETRYRKRYLDLIANERVRQIFRVRSRIIAEMRRFLEEEGFMEVETPILQPQAGGAEARPFVTHHNALDADLYLRIAPELYLKRCLVGGFERVFEIARCFRNEGISFQHNPEFTQVECYWAYADVEMMMDHIERLMARVIESVTGGARKIVHDGVELSFETPLPRLNFYDLVQKETGFDLAELSDEETLRAAMEQTGMKTEGLLGYGSLVDEIWKKKVRPTIVQPTFVTHYPAAMKPLAKRDPDHPERSSNAQLLIKGMEVMNGFDELNDPLEQEARFKEQEALKERGSEEAQGVDQDYLEALKIGMPPAAGYGIGIDRLCTLLTDTHNIKEVILFPTLKPTENRPEGSESE